MTTLIARLQAAKEGSRELSDEVLLAMELELDVKRNVWLGAGKRPDPTRDLTDAVAMVQEGWTWGVGLEFLSLEDGYIGVAEITPDEAVRSFDAQAATPALAVCTTILEAKEQEIEYRKYKG